MKTKKMINRGKLLLMLSFFFVATSGFILLVSFQVRQLQRQTSTVSQASAPSSSPLRVLFPLYTYPMWYTPSSYIWDDIAATAQSVGLIAIINPSSGPGGPSDPNSDYVRGLNELQNQAQMIGYVSTAYGNRAESLVKADIDMWHKITPRG